MFKKRAAILFILLFISAAVNLRGLMAQSYQFEVKGEYDYQKIEDGKFSLYTLGADVFFKQVNPEGGPYSEAAFLQKAGSFGVFGSRGQFKTDSDDGTDKLELDYKMFGMNLGYVIPVVPIILKAGYSHYSIEGDYTTIGLVIPMDIKIENFNGQLGYYFTDNFTLSASFAKEKAKMETGFGPEEKSEEQVIGGDFKYVYIINTTMGWNLEGGINFISSKDEGEKALKNRSYSIEGDFYPTRQIGIGGSVEFNRGDSKDYAGNTYGVNLSFFITPNIALAMEYKLFNAEDGDAGDTKDYIFRVTGRL